MEIADLSGVGSVAKTVAATGAEAAVPKTAEPRVEPGIAKPIPATTAPAAPAPAASGTPHLSESEKAMAELIAEMIAKILQGKPHEGFGEKAPAAPAAPATGTVKTSPDAPRHPDLGPFKKDAVEFETKMIEALAKQVASGVPKLTEKELRHCQEYLKEMAKRTEAFIDQKDITPAERDAAIQKYAQAINGLGAAINDRHPNAVTVPEVFANVAKDPKLGYDPSIRPKPATPNAPAFGAGPPLGAEAAKEVAGPLEALKNEMAALRKEMEALREEMAALKKELGETRKELATLHKPASVEAGTSKPAPSAAPTATPAAPTPTPAAEPAPQLPETRLLEAAEKLSRATLGPTASEKDVTEYANKQATAVLTATAGDRDQNITTAIQAMEAQTGALNAARAGIKEAVKGYGESSLGKTTHAEDKAAEVEKVVQQVIDHARDGRTPGTQDFTNDVDAQVKLIKTEKAVYDQARSQAETLAKMSGSKDITEAGQKAVNGVKDQLRGPQSLMDLRSMDDLQNNASPESILRNQENLLNTQKQELAKLGEMEKELKAYAKERKAFLEENFGKDSPEANAFNADKFVSKMMKRAIEKSPEDRDAYIDKITDLAKKETTELQNDKQETLGLKNLVDQLKSAQEAADRVVTTAVMPLGVAAGAAQQNWRQKVDEVMKHFADSDALAAASNSITHFESGDALAAASNSISDGALAASTTRTTPAPKGR